ncbi:energy transducer TonB [Bradyrhizobium sp. Arg816]|uniref:energy transducer TonB family protein n=1 Tax=Bradyrhizobium sp. Arg816 TaxID=2998491 RepID=UPI00249F3921|nr:energy transducer TonB [Bradyrhizobium sp. Arg816]MDI3567024.1 energy transducer TonB [Bradyrhizobium sp. Arg816]
MQMKFPLVAALLGWLAAFPAHAQTEPQSETVKAWKAKLTAHIVRNRDLPPEGRGQTGEAKVAFGIDRFGKLIWRALAMSAGSRPLDVAALDIIARVQPFPVPPPELKETSLTLTVPIAFNGRQFEVPSPGLELSKPDPASGPPDAMAVWRKEVTERVWRNGTFPPGAIGQRGDAGVTFVVNRSGKLISSALVESTGSPLLDAAALKMVERSEPFPNPPSDAKEDLQRVTVFMTLDGTPRNGGLGPWEDETKVKAKLNSICRGC